MSFFVSQVVAWIVLLPLVACVVVLWDALSRALTSPKASPGPKTDPPPATLGERAVVVGAGGAAVAALFAVLRLFTAGRGHGMVQLLRCVRIGMTDVSRPEKTP